LLVEPEKMGRKRGKGAEEKIGVEKKGNFFTWGQLEGWGFCLRYGKWKM